jgi:hypothetical protein
MSGLAAPAGRRLGVASEFWGLVCPLTPLEQRLRAGAEAYTGDFVGRYLLPLIYPGQLTCPLQLGLGLGVVLVNLVIYARLAGSELVGLAVDSTCDQGRLMGYTSGSTHPASFIS